MDVRQGPCVGEPAAFFYLQCAGVAASGAFAGVFEKAVVAFVVVKVTMVSLPLVFFVVMSLPFGWVVGDNDGNEGKKEKKKKVVKKKETGIRFFSCKKKFFLL